VRHLPHPERAVVTGNPVRADVLAASRERGREALGIRPDALMLLVFGGSRGARHINETMVSLAPELATVPSLRVVHVAGRMEAATVTAGIERVLGAEAGWYTVAEYIDEMGDAIASADLVVARAGATSIAEITAVGRAAVLVPYPYATDDHQTGNARAVADAGGAVIVSDRDLDGDSFARVVMGLLRDETARNAMAAAAVALGRPDAAGRVADLALAAATRRKEKR
jgi:UDP-N-acetylglucosamine--N-acetylmuramyl-(pentapeptide) pyrophosphoryl-undecaprenol N-acetylglucosamine transferase